MAKDEIEAAVDNDSDLAEMRASIGELRKSMELFMESLAPLQEAKAALEGEKRKAQEEYNERMTAIRTKGMEIDEQVFKARQQSRELSRQIESYERKYDDARRAKIAQAEFATLEKRWDILTAGAPWREWAKDHQIEAARRITLRNKMILADTMGLGKTLSSIAALDMIKAATKDATPDSPFGGEEYQTQEYNAETGNYETITKIRGGVKRPCGMKVLYVCPSTMTRNVMDEVKRWAPHRSVTSIANMPKAARRFAIDIMTQHPEYVVIVNYEAWRKDLSLIDSLIEIEFDTIIIDEAHNVKDRKSIAYRGLSRLVTESDVPFVLPMTGTPILNRPQELFSLLTLVAPQRFYSESAYLRDYCVQDPYTKRWAFRPGGLDVLAKRISHLYLRRTKEEAGIVLPPKTVVIHEIPVDEEVYAEQANARNQMRQWGSIVLNAEEGKAITAAAAIAVYTRLRQIETWPAGIQVTHPKTKEVLLKLEVEQSQKLDEVIHWDADAEEYEGILPEVVTDERVAVYSQFKAPLHELKARCWKAGIKAVILDGDTPDALKDEIRRNFDATYGEEKKWDVVLCNYRVGGVGLNFTNVTQMIIVDEEWNPGKRDQAYDRIHRMGQEKPVTIHVLRDKLPNGGGIDVWLSQIIQDKEGLVEGFASAMDLAEKGLDAIKSGLI